MAKHDEKKPESKEDTRNFMSSKQYVNSDGRVCPRCKSSEVKGGGIEVKNGIATRAAHCLGCNARWTEKYRLIGYTRM